MTNRRGIVRLLEKEGPMWEADISKRLKISKQLVSYHVEKGVGRKELIRLVDRRVAVAGYSESEEEVRREVVRLCQMYSLPGFFNEAEYHVAEVGVAVGRDPVKIADDYYRVVSRLRREWQQTGQVPSLVDR